MINEPWSDNSNSWDDHVMSIEEEKKWVDLVLNHSLQFSL